MLLYGERRGELMAVSRERLYRVGEVAALTGVSIRTLHHYDEIELLPPSGRSEAGYRLYNDADLLRLQQILTLRFLGFSLDQVCDLLSRPDFDVEASLRIQRRVLRDRIDELERIETVLGELLERRQMTGEWAWELVASASASIQAEMKLRGEQMSEYYTRDELQQRLAEIGKATPAEVIQQTEEDWTALVREVRANRDLDPSDPRAQALADRWNELTQDMAHWFGDDPKLANSIQRNYAEGVYAEIADAPTMEDFAFIQKVNAARKSE